MQSDATFNREADSELESIEGWLGLGYTFMSNGLTANIPVSTNSHHDDKDDQERKGNPLQSQMHPEFGMVVGIGMYLMLTKMILYLLT
jgi:hypothetical protein